MNIVKQKKKIEMSCGHSAHSKCLNEYLSMKFLNIEELKDIRCPNEEKKRCHRGPEYQECKCIFHCSCTVAKKCICLKDNICLCDHGRVCKKKIECYCKNLKKCNCKASCQCEPLTAELFKANSEDFSYSIHRKLKLLKLRYSVKLFQCKNTECRHKQYNLILDGKYRRYQIGCFCNSIKVCSYCHESNCLSNKRNCGKLLEKIEKLNLKLDLKVADLKGSVKQTEVTNNSFSTYEDMSSVVNQPQKNRRKLYDKFFRIKEFS